MSANDRYTVEMRARMLPAMLHALMIGRNTAMMCGQKGVEAEFKTMVDDLARQSGIPNLIRTVEEGQWFAACQALAKAKEYHWYVECRGRLRWDDPGSVPPGGITVIVVDGEGFEIARDLKEDTPHLAALQELLESHAAVDAVKGEPERHYQSWRSREHDRKRKEWEQARRERAEVQPSAPAPVLDGHGDEDDVFDGDDGDDDHEHGMGRGW